MCNTIILTKSIDNVHLVFHQCNQRRNDDGGSFHYKGRQLVAQAFSTTSRHQYKSIITCHQISDDSFLFTLKLIKAKIVFKLICKIYLFCHIQPINLYSYYVLWYNSPMGFFPIGVDYADSNFCK